MKEFFKKVALAIFGLVLAFGVTATPALAAEPTANVTIKNIAYGESNNPDVAVAYLLVKYTDSGNSYEFVDTAFQNYLADKATSGQSALNYLSSLSNSGVATAMTSYMRNWASAPAEYTKASAASGDTATLSLAPGYYLIDVTSNNGYSYSPMVVFVRYDGANTAVAYGTADGTTSGDTKEGITEIQAKRADAITIEKKVKRNNGTGWHDTKAVQTGDEVTFRVALTYPTYEENVDPHATLHDTLTNLKVSDVSAIALYADEDLTTIIPDGLVSDSTTVDTYDDQKNTQSIEALIDWDKVRAAVTTGNKVYIGYTATVMQQAAITGEACNEAYVTYLTSASSAVTPAQTPTDETNLYSFQFDLKKVKADGAAALAGAQFKVYTKGTSDSGTETLLNFVKVDDGYVLVSAANDGTTTVLDASFGDSANELKLYGLDPFQYYYVEEVTTPKGYAAPVGKFKLDLSSAMDTDAGDDNASGEHLGRLNGTWKTTDAGYADGLKSNADVTHSKFYAVSVNDDGLVSVDQQTVSGKCLTAVLKNSTTSALPTTGGMGTVVFTVVGVALMAGAAGFFVVRRRKQN